MLISTCGNQSRNPKWGNTVSKLGETSNLLTGYKNSILIVFKKRLPLISFWLLNWLILELYFKVFTFVLLFFMKPLLEEMFWLSVLIIFFKSTILVSPICVLQVTMLWRTEFNSTSYFAKFMCRKPFIAFRPLHGSRSY